MAFPRQAFPTSSKLKRRPTYTPYGVGLRVASTSSELRAHRALCPDTGPFRCPPYAESPFAPSGCYPSRSATLRHLARSYPHIIAPTGSCARPKPSHFLRPSPRQWVFAGCCQPLLGVGPSRHYLCNPCAGAWTPTPQCPPGAFARFFPEGNGLTLDVRRSAHQNYPCNATSTGKSSRGCSSASGGFRLPRSLDPQVAPTAEALRLQGGRAVYTTHSSVGYLPRDVASLRIRHEQLIRLDFHQLDCSLVGCSDVYDFMLFNFLLV